MSLPKVGDRVELVDMPNDPAPIPVGERGTVQRVQSFGDGSAHVAVAWDNGRRLNLCVPTDRFKILEVEP